MIALLTALTIAAPEWRRCVGCLTEIEVRQDRGFCWNCGHVELAGYDDGVRLVRYNGCKCKSCRDRNGALWLKIRASK